MKPLIVSIALCLGMVAPGTWSFEEDAPGKAPKGFEFTTTADAPAAKWIVRKDGENNVLAQVENKTDTRYASAIVKGTSYKDLRLSARLRGISGYQRVGILWRYQDKDNYYVVGINPAEGNVTWYRVVAGKRSRVARKVVKTLKSGSWYTLQVAHQGALAKVSLDGKALFEAEDDSFKKAGAVGVWIKDDTVAEFDNLTVEALE